MPSFGEKLRLEREKRKISLEQISSSTKIGTRMLQALEEDKFSQLPGGIFNKGFVRAYARVVGLDEDQAVADYLQASGDTPRPELVTRDGGVQDTGSRDATPRDSATRDEEHRISRLEAISDESPSRPLPWGMFAVALLVIALGLSLWSHRRREQERLAVHPTKTVQAPSTPENAAPGGSASPAETSTPPATTGAPTNSPSPSTNAAGASSAPAAPPTEKPASSPTQTSSQTSPRTGQNLSNTAPPASPGEFLVLIHAREESWVSVSIDGKFTGSEVLEAGSDRTFHAHSRISIKAGNAGALDFRLDGKKLDVGGDFGEVKSVTIGHAGVIPNPSPPPSNP